MQKSEIIEKLKSFYFFFEDHYYALLDKINKHIPVYKVIDPLDRAVPSFALFSALIFFLIIFFVFLSFSLVLFTAEISVLDQDGDALDGVSISLQLANQNIDITTDNWGVATVTLPKKELEALASFSKSGFLALSETLFLEDGQTSTVTLLAENLNFQSTEKQIKVVDAGTGILLSKLVTLSFSCQGNALAPETIQGRSGEFKVIQPSNCFVMTATANADDYQRKSKTVSSTGITYISLESIVEETTGTINLSAKEVDGTPVPDAVVRLIKESTNAAVDSSSTSQAGTASFSDVAPGSYTVSASTADGRNEQKSGVVVLPGKTTSVSIIFQSLAPGGASKKIFLKFIDRETQLPVSNVIVMLYDGNILVDSKTSNSLGIVEKLVADENTSFAAVISHSGYVTLIEPEVSLISASNTNPINILLDKVKYDPPNATAGKAIATVVDEENEPVEDASVWLYNLEYPAFPLNYPAKNTTALGEVLFSNLSEATYFAIAEDNGSQARGQSESKELVKGETIDLPIVLVIGEGSIEVTIYDAETLEMDPIIGASVKFFDAMDGSLLHECETDGEFGKCETPMIGADKTVSVIASAPGFVSLGYNQAIGIVDNVTRRIEMGLEPITSIESFGEVDTKFEAICSSNDPECDNPLSVVTSDPEGVTTYYGLFYVVLKDAVDYSEIVEHIRVGLDSELELPSTDYKIRITAASSPFSTNVELSKCWNGDNDNPFEDLGDVQGCAVSRGAKQANVYLRESTGPVELPVTVKFQVEAGLEDGTELRIYHKSKATAGTVTTSEEKLQKFIINQLFCAGTGIAWNFSFLEDDILTPLIPGIAQALTVNEGYNISYSLYNCSGQNLNPATLIAEPSQSPPILSFSATVNEFAPKTIFELQFSDSTEISSEDLSMPLYIRPVMQSTFTDLEFRLKSGEQLIGNAILNFNIETGKELRIDYYPNVLSSTGEPELHGMISDATNNETKIEGAFVKLIIPDPVNQSIEANNSGLTDSDGFFNFTDIPNLNGVDSVTLQVTKAGFNPFETTINVGQMPPTYNPNLECVKFVGDVAENGIILDRETAESQKIEIQTINCSQPVVVKLDSELLLSQETITLGPIATGNFDVTAKTAPDEQYPVGIGEYYINLYVKFENDPLEFFGPMQTIPVYITDDSSCFRMVNPDNDEAKSSFDLTQGEATGQIINTCYQFFEDLHLPILKKLRVHSANPEIFSLEYGLPPLPPDQSEVRVKQEVYNQLLESGTPLEFSITDTGGYVFLDWIDFFATDKMHNGPDLHKIEAQTFPGVWTNITAMVPYTREGTAISGPVIDNVGWIDTETYYNPVAVENEENKPEGEGDPESMITKDPIWQGQHNVCERFFKSFSDVSGSSSENTCLVEGPEPYFGGKKVQPYKAGLIANRIRMSIQRFDAGGGSDTILKGIKWKYVNNDQDHQGKIDFKVINNGVLGDSYALLEVEDSVLGTGLVSSDISFNWTLTVTGYEEWIDELTQLNENIELEPGKALVISADSSASPKFGLYDTVEEGESLAGTESDLKAFHFTATTDRPIEYQLKYFSEGIWIESDIIYEDINFSYTGIFDWNFNRPMPVSAVAIVNTGTDPDANTFTIKKVVLDRYSADTETAQTIGKARIAAGETRFTFDPSFPLLTGDFTRIEYTIDNDTEKVITYFQDSGTSITLLESATVVAQTTSPASAAVTGKELFHIKLEGQKLETCMGYSGLRGLTGKSAMPRVLFNWDWGVIDLNSCDVGNPDYIYCDPTQFSIELTKKLEKIRQLAEEDFIGNIQEIQLLRQFNAYLIGDALNPDFRNDFEDYYANRVFFGEFTSFEYPWGEYFKDSLRLVFDTGPGSGNKYNSGIYSVFIDFEFDDPAEQYKFFLDSEPVGTITVYLEKQENPLTDSPFYFLPFNGEVGIKDDLTFDRVGYGLKFNNNDNPIVIQSLVGGSPPILDTSSDNGEKVVETNQDADFESLNIKNRGIVLSVTNATDTEDATMSFYPSIAMPILMALIPESDKSEAYYYLTGFDAGVISSDQGYMSLWTGTGSSMGQNPAACLDFYGDPLFWRAPDISAPSNGCASSTYVPQRGNNSFGFYYDPAQDGQQLYFESIFYTPHGSGIKLYKTCPNNTMFYSPFETSAASGQAERRPISLASESSNLRIATVANMIDLINAEYICVSESLEGSIFWWNPQKLLGDLNSVKQGIDPNWDADLACSVSIGS